MIRKQCILSEQRFDFLKDLVNTVQDTSNGEEELCGASTPGQIHVPKKLASDRCVCCSMSIWNWALAVSCITYKTMTFFCKIIIFMLKRNNKALINTENYIKILCSIRNKNQPNRVLKDGCLINLSSKNFNIQKHQLSWQLCKARESLWENLRTLCQKGRLGRKLKKLFQDVTSREQSQFHMNEKLLLLTARIFAKNLHCRGRVLL